MHKKLLVSFAVLSTIGVLFVNLSGEKFRKRIDQDQQRVLAAAKKERPKMLLSGSAKYLPAPVQRYFKYALGGRQQAVSTARLSQAGTFRMKESDNWVPFEAVQHITATVPSFVWNARLRPLPYVWTEARDMLYLGKADMVHRAYSAFPLAFASGKEEDLSALVRFLAESPWVPTALVSSEFIEWEKIDNRSAKAIMRLHNYAVSADFTFNDRGEITRATTFDRYRSVDGKNDRQQWTVHYGGYQTFQGMKIPTDVELVWNLAGGDFPYARFTVTGIQYDIEGPR